MIKKYKWRLILMSLITVAPSIVFLLMWDTTSGLSATRWSSSGQNSGVGFLSYMLVLLPVILLIFFWLAVLLTARDHRNREQSGKVLKLIFWMLPTLSVLVSVLIYTLAMDAMPNATYLIPLIVGLLFVVIGNYLPKCRQNKWIGVRVKWTLRSKQNWQATHRYAGKIWVIGGLVIMLLALLPEMVALIGMLTVLLVMIILPTVYSYRYYKRFEEADAKNEPAPPRSRKKLIVTVSIVLVILILVGVLMFTGEVTYDFGRYGIRFSCTYYSSLQVDYAAMTGLGIREDFDIGSRVGGLGSPRLQVGTFHNSEFDNYTLYAYTSSKHYVVITAGERILVVGLKTQKDALDLYANLFNYMTMYN